MEFPDPEEFTESNKDHSHICKVVEVLESNPEARVWLDDVLNRRAALPQPARVKLEKILETLNTCTGASLNEYHLKYYVYRIHRRAENEPTRPEQGSEQREQDIITSQRTDALPPGWEAEQPAASLPTKAEADDTR